MSERKGETTERAVAEEALRGLPPDRRIRYGEHDWSKTQLDDWYFTGRRASVNIRRGKVYRHGPLGNSATRECCDLCGEASLLTLFETRNRRTDETMWMGSNCVLATIPMRRDGELLEGPDKEAEFKVLVENERQRRAFEILDRLADHDSRFNDHHWRRDWELGYSPKQVRWIAKACRYHRVPGFEAHLFRINTRRPRYRLQLKEFSQRDYKLVRGALIDKWRREFDALMDD